LGFFPFVFCCPSPHRTFLLSFHPKRQILPPKRISDLHSFILTSLSVGMTSEKKKNELKKKDIPQEKGGSFHLAAYLGI